MRKIILTVSLLGLAFYMRAQPYYQQNNGVIAIEAEHYTSSSGEWEEVEGRNAEPMEKQGQGIDNQKGIISGRFISLSNKETRVGWGIPFENAEITAYTDSRQMKAAIFAYAENEMAGEFKIPAYRAFITWPTTEFSEEGWALFQNVLIKTMRRNNIENFFFVHGGEAPGELDQKIINWIKTQGISMKTCSDEALENTEIPQIPVLISESVSSGRVNTHFRMHTSPVVIGEPFVLNKMGMVASKKAWQQVEGEFGNAIMVANPQKKDSLIYAIHIEGEDSQKISILAQGADKRVDEKIILNLFSCDTRKKVKSFDITLSPELTWIGSDPFHLTDGDYLLVIKAKEETLSNYESIKDKRYPSYRIDKIIIADRALNIKGNGYSSVYSVLPDYLKESLHFERFLPKQIWKTNQGVAIIEAEDIDHHENWQFMTKPSGYTGKGYLVWNGPSRTQSIEGLGGNDDDNNVRQGPQEQMLIIRIYVETDGIYCVNARNIHQLEDGDNDAWVSLLGFKPWNEGAFDDRVRRMGDSHSDGKGFTWLDWGVREFPLKAGLNNIYIGGRSVGFGIDRIAIYPANNEDAKKRALRIDAQISELK
ncbi:MAG: hypothetical protein JXA77_05855 [Bacteroidales bacterium]|nr:hypothetical protein [Bacteroidales bacterium]